MNWLVRKGYLLNSDFGNNLISSLIWLVNKNQNECRVD